MQEKISNLLSSNSIAKNSTELKAKRFFKNGKNLACFKKIFDYFISELCFPIFTILDKSYMVAFKIIETIFDPTYSVLLKDNLTGDFHFKRNLAKIVISDKNIINSFSNLIHGTDLNIDNLRNICNELAERFLSISCKSISSYLCNLSDQTLEKMLDEFQVENCERSLTIPALFHVLQLTQNYCYNYNVYAQILHDNIKGYNKWIDIIKNNFLNGNVPNIIKIGNNKFYSNFSHISSIKFCDSKNEYFIQLADLLIGFILRTLKSIQNSQTLSEEQQKILQSLIVLHDTLQLWDYVIDDDFMKKLFICLNSKYTNNSKLPDYTSLEKKFRNYLK